MKKLIIVLVLMCACLGCDDESGLVELSDCEEISECFEEEHSCSEEFIDDPGSCGKIFADMLDCIDENGCSYSCECHYSNFKMACGD